HRLVRKQHGDRTGVLLGIEHAHRRDPDPVEGRDRRVAHVRVEALPLLFTLDLISAKLVQVARGGRVGHGLRRGLDFTRRDCRSECARRRQEIAPVAHDSYSPQIALSRISYSTRSESSTGLPFMLLARRAAGMIAAKSPGSRPALP